MAGEDRMFIVEIESVGPVEVELTGENPSTAEALLAALPAESAVSTWGDEIYFEMPLRHDAEDARAEVEVGDVAWWPAGSCLCLFFGPTPASPGDAPVAASPVNVIGRVVGDPRALSGAAGGDRIEVSRGP
jgi:hypothetical protein